MQEAMKLQYTICSLNDDIISFIMSYLYLNVKDIYNFLNCSNSVSNMFSKVIENYFLVGSLKLYPWQFGVIQNILDLRMDIRTHFNTLKMCIEYVRKVATLASIMKIKKIHPQERILIISDNENGWINDALKLGFIQICEEDHLQSLFLGEIKNDNLFSFCVLNEKTIVSTSQSLGFLFTNSNHNLKSEYNDGINFIMPIMIVDSNDC